MRCNRPLLLAVAMGAMAFSQATASKSLLIVAPRTLMPALADYVAYKKMVMPVETTVLENVLAANTGADDPEKLKRFIYEQWRSRHVGYVLLVGDRDTMPIRFLTSLKFSTFDYLFQPTDFYYADLTHPDGSFNDWNANKGTYHAGYYGEVNGDRGHPINLDNIHYHPDVAVGRWPVSTPEAVLTIAAKSMTYEHAIRAGTHPGMRTAAFFHVNGWVDARDEITRLARSLPPGWTGQRFLYQDGNAAFRSEAPTVDALDAEFNRGAGFIAHIGHGETDSWIGYPGSYRVDGKLKVNELLSPRTMAGIHNADRLPVVMSVGCSTSYFAPLGPNEGYIDVDGHTHAGEARKETFDGPPPPPSPYQKNRLIHSDSLGKQLLEDGPDGAVAYIGSDMVAQPPGLTLLDGFVESLKTTPDPRIGDSWNAAIVHYYEVQSIARLAPDGNWVKPATFMQPMKFNLFGDPSLPMAAGR